MARTPRHMVGAIRSCVLAGLVIASHAVVAQEPVLKFPADGRQVQFVGIIKKRVPRSTAATEFHETVEEHTLAIRSLGREMAKYRGTWHKCRWLEFDIRTYPCDEGKPVAKEVRMYKVLVAESLITTLFQGRVPAELPIVRGRQQVGNAASTAIKSRTIQLYPSIFMFAGVGTLEIDAEKVNPEVAYIDDDSRRLIAVRRAKCLRGSGKSKSQTVRVTREAKLWVSEDVPVGLVRWHASAVREEKDRADPESAFAEASRVDLEMVLFEAAPARPAHFRRVGRWPPNETMPR